MSENGGTSTAKDVRCPHGKKVAALQGNVLLIQAADGCVVAIQMPLLIVTTAH